MMGMSVSNRLIFQKHLIQLQTILMGLFVMLSSNAQGKHVSLKWNEGNENDIAGYKVYMGTESGTYPMCFMVGNQTSHTVINLLGQDSTYFAVTAYDKTGNESDYSWEVVTEVSEVRMSFSLQANYPNPFNPVTQIPFTLFQRMPVHLAVYDLLGREVKLIAKGEKGAGNYLFQWDGTNNMDNSVANGIYFCRLIVGEFCQTQKLILTR